MFDNFLPDGSEDLLAQFQGHVRVMEHEVDLQTQMEYTNLLAQAMKGKNTVAESAAYCEKAFDHRVSEHNRKFLMVALSRTGDVKVLRAFEHYLESDKCPPSMLDFVRLCTWHCRAHIEASLLDENYAMVTSGLGGDGKRMRYFAALATTTKKEWSATQQHVLYEELRYAAKSYGAEVEKMEFSKCYAKISLLMPVEKLPDEMVSVAVKNCNDLGEFIDQRAMLTNVTRLPDEELAKIFVD